MEVYHENIYKGIHPRYHIHACSTGSSLRILLLAGMGTDNRKYNEVGKMIQQGRNITINNNCGFCNRKKLSTVYIKQGEPNMCTWCYNKHVKKLRTEKKLAEGKNGSNRL